MDSPTGDPAATLARRLNVPLLTLYGLGTTVGAGIYALMGEVAARAGMATPLSFFLAALIATLSALSFAEMGARYPRSAGEALYVSVAFGSRRLALFIGMLVVVAGCVSAAAIANGFVNYLTALAAWDRTAAIVAIVGLLGAIAAWGILESVAVAAVVTVIEIGGIVAVLLAALHGLAELPPARELIVAPDATGIAGMLGGALLAFYAFIGFEDMVNVAEEVVDVRNTLPRSIVLTLVITAVLYLALAAAAVLTVPPDELAASGAPLMLVYDRAGGPYPAALGLIAIVAMLNGALIQVIMASRVLYGLASEGSLPGWLAAVAPRTRTPLRATVSVTGVVLALALGFRLAPLAEATSLTTLVVFTAVNAAAFRIKRREPKAPGALGLPAFLPATAVALNLLALGFAASRFF